MAETVTLPFSSNRFQRQFSSGAGRPLYDVQTVESRYRDAMALASELGMRPLVAHCHLGLGRLSRRTGKQQEAQEHLKIATTMYREMGMTYWLDRAEAEKC